MMKKIHETVKRPAPAGIPEAWFLMSKEEISIRTLRAIFSKDEPVDMWPEAGVLEIMIGDRDSIDIEIMDAFFEDEADRKFLADEGVKTLFSLVFDPGLYEKALPVLKRLAEGIDGFICGDTPDFAPIIKK